MSSIRVHSEATVDQVMKTVRATFESRDYLWEQSAPDTAVASEGGRAVRTAALPVAQRVRVSINFRPTRHKLVLGLETVGAVYSSAGSGWFHIRLSSRYRKLVKAARKDLEAASLR